MTSHPEYKIIRSWKGSLKLVAYDVGVKHVSFGHVVGRYISLVRQEDWSV